MKTLLRLALLVLMATTAAAQVPPPRPVCAWFPLLPRFFRLTRLRCVPPGWHAEEAWQGAHLLGMPCSGGHRDQENRCAEAATRKHSCGGHGCCMQLRKPAHLRIPAPHNAAGLCRISQRTRRRRRGGRAQAGAPQQESSTVNRCLQPALC